jgi:hypothetical protein
MYHTACLIQVNGLNSPAIATSSNPPTPTNSSICRYISYTCKFRSSLPSWSILTWYPRFSPGVLMGKHCDHHHQSSDRPQPDKALAQPSRPTSTTSSLLAKALSLGRESNASPAPSASASENPTPTPTPSAIQPLAHDAPRPARQVRVPAVTSKSMTTAPVRDKSRPHRRKYPT